MEAYQRKQRELLADAIMCQEIEQKDQLGLSGSMSIQSLGRGERMEPEDLSAAWSGADQDEGVEYGANVLCGDIESRYSDMAFGVN